jgi:hypothetical protein
MAMLAALVFDALVMLGELAVIRAMSDAASALSAARAVAIDSVVATEAEAKAEADSSGNSSTQFCLKLHPVR